MEKNGDQSPPTKHYQRLWRRLLKVWAIDKGAKLLWLKRFVAWLCCFYLEALSNLLQSGRRNVSKRYTERNCNGFERLMLLLTWLRKCRLWRSLCPNDEYSHKQQGMNSLFVSAMGCQRGSAATSRMSPSCHLKIVKKAYADHKFTETRTRDCLRKDAGQKPASGWWIRISDGAFLPKSCRRFETGAIR